MKATESPIYVAGSMGYDGLSSAGLRSNQAVLLKKDSYGQREDARSIREEKEVRAVGSEFRMNMVEIRRRE